MDDAAKKTALRMIPYGIYVMTAMDVLRSARTMCDRSRVDGGDRVTFMRAAVPRPLEDEEPTDS